MPCATRSAATYTTRAAILNLSRFSPRRDVCLQLLISSQSAGVRRFRPARFEEEIMTFSRGMIYALVFAVLCLMVVQPMSAQSGADLFKAKCAMCHGPDGKGQTA